MNPSSTVVVSDDRRACISTGVAIVDIGAIGLMVPRSLGFRAVRVTPNDKLKDSADHASGFRVSKPD